MLKRIVFTVALLIFVIPSLTMMAHTHLKTTNPEEGATVTEAVTEISLQYEGKILEGSSFELVTSNNGVIKPDGVILNDNNLIGTFVKPLLNDTYVVNWSSVSGDGHPLNGSFSFKVEAPSINENDIIEKEEVAETEEKNSDFSNMENEEGSSTYLYIVVIILLIILLIGTVVFFKAGKKKK